MKIITQLVIFSFLFLSAYAATEPVMSLITVNTEDTAGYRDWAKGSSDPTHLVSACISKTNGASAVGLCSPRIGAEEMGDLYFWSLFDSNETAWKTDPNNPVIAKEVAEKCKSQEQYVIGTIIVWLARPVRLMKNLQVGTSWSKQQIYLNSPIHGGQAPCGDERKRV